MTGYWVGLHNPELKLAKSKKQRHLKTLPQTPGNARILADACILPKAIVSICEMVNRRRN
jgi:hypothetical protein